MIIYLALNLVDYLITRDRKIPAFISCFSFFSVIYLLILIGRRPAVLFQTELFSPYRYTMNAFIPSLGHLLVLCILLSVLAFVCFRNLKPDRINLKTGYLTLTLLMVPGALLFALYHIVFSHLIFNSNINFETFKVLDLNIFSLTGFVAVILLFGIPFLYTLRVFQIMKQPEAKTVLPVCDYNNGNLHLFPFQRPGGSDSCCPFLFSGDDFRMAAVKNKYRHL